MPRESKRRRFLRTLSSLPVVASGVTAFGSRASTASGGRFDPASDGFGFRNWSTTDPQYPTHDHSHVSEDEIRRTIKRNWKKPMASLLDVSVSGLPSVLVNTIAEQVYVTANQLSATNGHCYGMVFTAQQYFEEPDTFPLGVDGPPAVENPEAPTGDAKRGPVADEVDLYQTSQALSLYAWLGRRNMVRPKWIDYEAQLANLTAVVDEMGTAGITIFDPASNVAHQVLVYDYEVQAKQTRLSLYDPNFAARFYRRAQNRKRATITVDTSGDRPKMEPYRVGFDGPGYEQFDGFTEFVYNRWDRVIRSRADPPNHLTANVDDATLENHLLSLVMFCTDTEDVAVSVSNPDGRAVGRLQSDNIDRRQTDHYAMRYQYGAPDGAYHVAVTGKRATEYTLETKAADPDGELLASSVTTDIDAGQTHAYTVTVPDSAGKEGDVERGGSGMPGWLASSTRAAAAGALVGGTLGYVAGRRESGSERGADDE